MSCRFMGRAALLTELLEIPLYTFRVPAGFPSPADDFIETKIDLNRLCVRQPEATYFVQASGDSMVDAGIEEGDLLIVDSSLSGEARDGQIIIAVLDGECTIKRLRLQEGNTWLCPENKLKGYQPIRVTEAHDFRIWGVVTGSYRQFPR